MEKQDPAQGARETRPTETYKKPTPSRAGWWDTPSSLSNISRFIVLQLPQKCASFHNGKKQQKIKPGQDSSLSHS